MAALLKEMKQAHANNGRRSGEVMLALNDLRDVFEKPSDDADQVVTSGLAEIKLLMQQSQYLPEVPKETHCAMTSDLANTQLLLQQSQCLTEKSKESGRSGHRSQGRRIKP